jgi:hypothetical protein
MDRGLISKKLRGLGAISVRSGPRVDFTRVQSSPAGAQKGERSTGSSARASPELGWRCSDRATVVQNREAAALGERSAQAWREGKSSGERCGETR